MSSPLPSPRGSYLDLPLLQSDADARETDTDHALLAATPPPKWHRFSMLTSVPGLLLTPPPRYATSRSDGTRLQSIVRQSYQDFVLGACAIPCCLVTLLYAYGATLGRPALQGVYKSNGITIFVLWVLSQLSVFLVRQLIARTFERLRWALASGENGILLTNFVGMSQATSLSGVLRLLQFRSASPQRRNVWGQVGGRVQWWMIQRFNQVNISESN